MPAVNTDWNTFEEEFRSCRKCEAAGCIPAARPLTLITPGARVYLVGQAPSRTDHETRGFYVGPAGEKLKGWLVTAGFTADALGTTIYATAMTRCFPGRKQGMSTDRAPSRAEQKLCSTWMDRELTLLDIQLIIPFGTMAINRFLCPGPLTERIGNVYEYNGIPVVPLPHSSGASTWLNSQENEERLVAAIGAIASIRSTLS
ncbi:MAG: uracil-DNA glycosylase family protein [Armatimonadota bacterium]